MQCDICGKKGSLYKANIEEVDMSVCDECGQFGRIIKKVKTKRDEPINSPKTHKREIIERIIKRYGEKVKISREKKGLKQKGLAQEISEKESLIHHIEAEQIEPSMKLAKKLESFLGIILIEKVEIEAYDPEEQEEEVRGMTLGDMVKITTKSKK
jgi:putative transcription factor